MNIQMSIDVSDKNARHVGILQANACPTIVIG